MWLKGECQSLLGLEDGKDLRIVRICPQGFTKEEEVAQLSCVKKETLSKTGPISGGEDQGEIDRNVNDIVNNYGQLFTGIGRAKVEPVHIDVDPAVKPMQQKRRPMAFHYVEKFKAHLEELKAAGVVSGPLGSEHAKGWI